jgi:hypothetical protein
VELQLVLRDELLQFRDKLAAEDTAESLDGQEESARRVDPSGTIEG